MTYYSRPHTGTKVNERFLEISARRIIIETPWEHRGRVFRITLRRFRQRKRANPSSSTSRIRGDGCPHDPRHSRWGVPPSRPKRREPIRASCDDNVTIRSRDGNCNRPTADAHSEPRDLDDHCNPSHYLRGVDAAFQYTPDDIQVIILSSGP